MMKLLQVGNTIGSENHIIVRFALSYISPLSVRPTMRHLNWLSLLCIGGACRDNIKILGTGSGESGVRPNAVAAAAVVAGAAAGAVIGGGAAVAAATGQT